MPVLISQPIFMRFEVVNAIYEAGLQDERIYFLTGDLGHAKTEEFKKNLRGRYYNTGMAEQHMASMAAGLALSGKKVFIYSIAPFVTLRCFEQIKVDICLHNADVTIVGVGSGFAYGSAGATHYSLEEVAALRALPNMKIVCPATPYEARVLTKEIIRRGGPTYIRIGRGKEPNLPTTYPLTFGKACVMRRGSDVTLIASGTILLEALRAAELCAKHGVDVEVAHMHTIKPLDHDFILDRAATRSILFTLEDHMEHGGLGGAVAEVVAALPSPRAPLRRFGVPDTWPRAVGSQEYLRHVFGLSAEKVAEVIVSSVRSSYGHH